MRTRRSLAAIVLLWFTVAFGLSARPSVGEEVADFFNVVAPAGADPWVCRHDGWYYATVTTGRNVVLIRSKQLSTLGAGDRRVVWDPRGGSPIARNLWAPELHRLGAAWYIYVAADDGDNANHRMYVLENKSADPFEGSFVDKGRIADPSHDRWAIDGTVLQLGAQLYFVWSGWEGAVNDRQNLYLAPMRNPCSLAGPRVEISRPTHPWETRGAPPAVNEGPQVLVRDRRVFLFYSASGSWTDDYCLGMLSASVEANLLEPASWTKHDKPVLASVAGVHGPGHGSFVKSPDDREDWLIYHAARHQGAGWTRLIRAQRLTWTTDGFPRLGLPAAPDRPIPLPGGEPKRQRFQAETAALEGGARPVLRPNASQGASVLVAEGPDSTLAFEVHAKKAGTYIFTIRYLNRSERHAPAVQSLFVNDDPPVLVSYPGTGPGSDWSNSFVTGRLQRGRNRIRLGGKERQVEVDCVDVVPEDGDHSARD